MLKILNLPLKSSLKCHIGRCRSIYWQYRCQQVSQVSDQPIFSWNWRPADTAVELLTFESQAYSCCIWKVSWGSLDSTGLECLGGRESTDLMSFRCLENLMTVFLHWDVYCPSGRAAIFSVGEIWFAVRQTQEASRKRTNPFWRLQREQWEMDRCPVFRCSVVSCQRGHGDQSCSSQGWDLHLQHGAVPGGAVVSQLDLPGVQLWVWRDAGGGAHTHKMSLKKKKKKKLVIIWHVQT